MLHFFVGSYCSSQLILYVLSSLIFLVYVYDVGLNCCELIE